MSRGRRSQQRRRRYFWALSLTALLAVASAAGLAWVWRDQAPLDEALQVRFLANRTRLELPSAAGAERIDRADEHLARALEELRSQNRRVYPWRDYAPVRFHLREARRLCVDGLEAARQARAEDLDVTARRLARLDRELRQAADFLLRVDGDQEAKVRLASAEGRLAALRAHVEEIDGPTATEILDAAESEISATGALLRRRLDGFLGRRPLWNRWVDEALRWSRGTDQPAVVVDKLEHRCYLLRRGQVVSSFPVEFGDRWMERKLYEGDRATPEGRYEITLLKGKGGSRFYKAALLDYPNAEDRQRFERARRGAEISSRARIGGLIEIHGEGGRGHDWTQGCVSLANDDLDRLFPHLRPGTPVTIVGVWKLPAWISDAVAVGSAAPTDRGAGGGDGG